jgi:hypothetical protein
MPFFRSSTGVQINCETFYDVVGDINVHSTVLEEEHDRDPSLTLESDADGMGGFTSYSGETSPTDRNDRALEYGELFQSRDHLS